MLNRIDITASQFGTRLHHAGFTRVSARRYLLVTQGDVAQRIELRPNRYGGEITCDLTIHPLWARESVTLEVLEPGIWIGTLCAHFGETAPTWYERSQVGIQQMVDSLATAGLRWFEANATAEGILQSASDFAEPWRSEQIVHVDLGHCYLRAGRLEEARRIFDRKPSRVPRYKTLADWISQGDLLQIENLHSQWIVSSRASLPRKVVAP